MRPESEKCKPEPEFGLKPSKQARKILKVRVLEIKFEVCVTKNIYRAEKYLFKVYTVYQLTQIHHFW